MRYHMNEELMRTVRIMLAGAVDQQGPTAFNAQVKRIDAMAAALAGAASDTLARYLRREEKRERIEASRIIQANKVLSWVEKHSQQ